MPVPVTFLTSVARLVAVVVLLQTGVSEAAQAEAPVPDSQQAEPLTGIVRDATGAPVPDAGVRLDADGVPGPELRTGDDGRFAFTVAPRPGLRVVVTAAGFGQVVQTVAAGGDVLEIVLEPAPFFEAVNVTSSRADAPRVNPTATVTVMTAADLLSSAPLTLDDALKVVPGFTLFRRTSSRTANPTTQGVTLRGIGGTAQSRSLVLADGIPLNDAFGGWVYWNKIPQAAIDRVEVQRGSGSDLYGADAVGGVIQVLTRRPARPAGRAIVEGGTLGTGRVSLYGGGRRQGWRYGAGAEWFTIDGYVPVAASQDPGIAPRGPIDGRLGSTHQSALLTAGYQHPNGWRADVSGNVYAEDRDNATPASINTTASRQLSVESGGAVGGGFLSVRVYGGTQQYRQTFSTVNATRTAEALTRDQNVPTATAGLGGQWFRQWGRHAVLVGAEGRRIDGESIEIPYAQGRPQATTRAGGVQRLGSAFVQDTIAVSDRLTVVLGAHGDGWASTADLTGFVNRSGAFNPRASGSYRLGGGDVTVRGAVYQGFRAPTLNEFYRNFGSGNTQTRPNEALGPERLTGGDLGVVVARGRASARVTGFWNVLDDAITTITLSSTPQLIVRQRANADTLHASGLELEGQIGFPGSLTATVGAGFVRSRFRGNTPLRDKDAPQVPAYNVGVDLRYSRRAWTASTQFRVTGPQFEDDQNVYELRRASVLDAFVSRRLADRATAFVAVENVFDNEYDVGRTPALTTGLPRAARAGVILALP